MFSNISLPPSFEILLIYYPRFHLILVESILIKTLCIIIIAKFIEKKLKTYIVHCVCFMYIYPLSFHLCHN